MAKIPDEWRNKKSSHTFVQLLLQDNEDPLKTLPLCILNASRMLKVSVIKNFAHYFNPLLPPIFIGRIR
jgi:hypothetical protein